MGDNKVVHDDPRDEMTPVRDGRVIEEPAGFDNPPTERIPVPGDLSDGQTGPKVSEDQPEQVEPVTDRTESVTLAEPEPVTPAEPVTDFAEPAAAPVESKTPAGFFDGDTVTSFRDRWQVLQSDFVDDPARAVSAADELVDEVINELAQRKNGLEEQWRDGPDDTEELRVAMREYRSFFNQLLNS